MESETNPTQAGQPSPTIRGAGEPPTSPKTSAPEESVQTGLGRAGAYVKEKMAGYREGGIEQISETSLNTRGPSPMMALMIATGVGQSSGCY
jgi:hypothetical protein